MASRRLIMIGLLVGISILLILALKPQTTYVRNVGLPPNAVLELRAMNP